MINAVDRGPGRVTMFTLADGTVVTTDFAKATVVVKGSGNASVGDLLLTDHTSTWLSSLRINSNADAPAGCFDLPNSGVDDGNYIKFTTGLRLRKASDFDPGRAQNGGLPDPAGRVLRGLIGSRHEVSLVSLWIHRGGVSCVVRLCRRGRVGHDVADVRDARGSRRAGPRSASRRFVVDPRRPKIARGATFAPGAHKRPGRALIMRILAPRATNASGPRWCRLDAWPLCSGCNGSARESSSERHRPTLCAPGATFAGDAMLVTEPEASLIRPPSRVVSQFERESRMNGIAAETIKMTPTSPIPPLTMVEIVGSPRQSPAPYPLIGASWLPIPAITATIPTKARPTPRHWATDMARGYASVATDGPSPEAPRSPRTSRCDRPDQRPSPASGGTGPREPSWADRS